MSTRLGDLVDSLGGELIGDPALQVSGIAPLDAAGLSHVTFLSNPKLRQAAAATGAGALILSRAEHEKLAGFAGARILSDNPYAYFARAAQYFAALCAQPALPGIHPSASIDPDAKVAATATIGPMVTIEAGAEVGERCVIGAGCFIGRDARIGAHTLLHPNVSILSDCRIGDDVEIDANTTVDRGALDHTVIEDGVKLDNQIQIAHNCVIGAHTAMAGCVGVAGSAKIGRHCTFGGAAMVLGHLTIADNVHISSGSLVSRSISEPGQYTGFYPLAKNADWEKTAAVVRQLDAMRDRVRELERAVRELTPKDE